MTTNLQSIMKGIGTALTYDDEGNLTAANTEYLKNIVTIASYLQSTSLSEAETNRLYSLARQCLDRSEEISKTKSKPPIAIQKPPTTTIQEPVNSDPSPNSEQVNPLEAPFLEARAKNKQLYENYLQRVYKIKSQYSSNPRQMQAELSELNLSYIREYTENISIAKDKHDKLVALSEQKKRQAKLGDVVSKKQKRRSPLYSLPPLVKQRDKQWRKSLLPDADNRATIQEHLSEILSNHKHYLGKLVEEFIISWKYNSAVNLTSLDTQKDEFPELRAPENETVTIGVIEETVFPKIYGNLFELYKIKYSKDDTQLQNQCNLFKEVTTQQIGIEKHFQLEGLMEPYREAIQELHTLCFRLTPYNKLQCLVSVSRNIVACAEKYFSMINDTKKHVIGADQLLPIMTYVVIKADLPNGLSECNFLSDFIDEKSMAGELGYTLASFQTCLLYVSNLSWNEINQNSKVPETSHTEPMLAKSNESLFPEIPKTPEPNTFPEGPKTGTHISPESMFPTSFPDIPSPSQDLFPSFPTPPTGPPPPVSDLMQFPEFPTYTPTTFPAPPAGPPPAYLEPDSFPSFPTPPTGPPPAYKQEEIDIPEPDFDPDILEDLENVELNEEEERQLQLEFENLK